MAPHETAISPSGRALRKALKDAESIACQFIDVDVNGNYLFAMKDTVRPPDLMPIGEMVAAFGVTARTLRFYEAEGLLHPRRQGSARLYSPRDRARLKLILRGKRFGFSLAEIRELLDLYDLGDGQATQLAATRARAVDKLAAMERQRADLDDAISDLRGQISEIDRKLTRNALAADA